MKGVEKKHSSLPTPFATKACLLKHIYVAEKWQKALQDITTIGSTYCIILGENELKSGKVELKEMASRKTEAVKLDSLTNEIQTRWNNQ